MREQGQQVGRSDDFEIARPSRFAPWHRGQISPLSLAEAWSAASSTPGDGAIRPSRLSSPTMT